MRVYCELKEGSIGSVIEYTFELDAGDLTEANSFNSRREKIKLRTNNCSFFFPFKISLPHPDLCALAALKIISPYVGSMVKFDRSVSKEFADTVKAWYKNIKKVNFSKNIQPRSKNYKRYGLAFSGGADSTAAAFLLDKDVSLISLIRKLHPDVGGGEKGSKQDDVSGVLQDMPATFNKIAIETDFPYTSVRSDDKCIVMADEAWHSVPIFLLADHLSIGFISQGNTLGFFLGNESKFKNLTNLSRHHELLFGAVGLNSVQPLAGCSEVISEKICLLNERSERTFTCNFGSFEQPCMQCAKCFRKSLIKAYLANKPLSKEELERFNHSKRLEVLSHKFPIPFTVTLKFLLSPYENLPEGPVKRIRKAVRRSYSGDPSWITRVYTEFYNKPKQVADGSILRRLTSNYCQKVSRKDVLNIEALDLRGSKNKGVRCKYESNIKEIMIISSPRSGTNYFCDTLDNLVGGISLFEIFNDEGVFGIKKAPSFLQALSQSQSKNFEDGSDPDLIRLFRYRPLYALEEFASFCEKNDLSFFSYKLFPKQLDHSEIENIMNKRRPLCVFIIRNRLDVYISYKKARKTSVWKNKSTENIRIDLDVDDFLSWADEVDKWYSRCFQTARLAGIQPIIFSYESQINTEKENLIEQQRLLLASHGVKCLLPNQLPNAKFNRQDAILSPFEKIDNGVSFRRKLMERGELEYALSKPFVN
ncbi:DUF6395 domain-containing protein [Flexibacterium corallicola]|uniref:DUF6395 domain-containing protein n=1 Tax=Flexibacterium corallicola TaxID=3037259 RepID=UPI00286EC8A2|nr:DUF6395 domain-containing protein [Pseudovibrio sp. M1P-2-3]